MKHQPFEDWLLNDQPLMPAEQRDLNRHILACKPCASLVRATRTLRAAPFVRPANGFVLRFQRRLEAERSIQRKRTRIGAALLALASIGLLAWLLAPALPFLSLSPVQMFMHCVNAMVYLAAAAQAVGIVGEVLLRLILTVLPPSIWLFLFTITIGLGALLALPLRNQGSQKAYSQTRFYRR